MNTHEEYTSIASIPSGRISIMDTGEAELERSRYNDKIDDVNEELDIYERKIADMESKIEFLFAQNKELRDEVDRKIANRKRSEKELRAKIDELTLGLNSERILNRQLRTRLDILEAKLSPLEESQYTLNNDQPIRFTVNSGTRLKKDGPDPYAITAQAHT